MITGYIPCHRSNYTKGRTSSIKYIVLHYTGNNGDTARGNCTYFSRENKSRVSAHVFVDEAGAWQSVPFEDTAHHVGAKSYKHKLCRNFNSIGIEMCSRIDSNGNYYIPEATVVHTVKLVRALMDTHNVPAGNILRHYDVTGKECPRPWVRDETNWQAFLSALERDDEMSYETFKEYMKRYETEQAIKPPAYCAEDWEEATRRNIVDGSRPMEPLLRLEYAVSEMRRVKDENY